MVMNRWNHGLFLLAKRMPWQSAQQHVEGASYESRFKRDSHLAAQRSRSEKKKKKKKKKKKLRLAFCRLKATTLSDFMRKKGRRNEHPVCLSGMQLLSLLPYFAKREKTWKPLPMEEEIQHQTQHRQHRDIIFFDSRELECTILF